MFPGGCALDCPAPARPPAFPQQQWTTRTWICPTRTCTYARRSAPTRLAAAPWTTTSMRSSRTQSTTPARRRARYLSLPPSLSSQYLPHLSLVGEELRGAQGRVIHTAADPGGRVDSLRRGSTRRRIQGGRVYSLLPRRGSTRRRHGSTARRPQPAAMAQILRG